jgi:large subunit ribosomal protein L9
MKVFLLKNVEKVGMAGQVLTVTDGYGMNFLIPRKLAVQITAENESAFQNRIKQVEHRKEVVATETSMLAERIKSIELTLKRKMHDEGKLFGAVSTGDIVDLLAQKGVSVAKNQIIFDKSIKAKGTYDVTIKLSSKLQPQIKVHVLPE